MTYPIYRVKMKLQKNKREKEREVQSTRNAETKPRKENERKEGTDHQNTNCIRYTFTYRIANMTILIKESMN